MNYITNTEKQAIDNPASILLAAMTASRSGGDIEAMERRGQEQLCKSDVLPWDIREARPALEKLGVKFGQQVEGDPLFQHVTFPPGWKIVPNEDHAMWSTLVTDKGKAVLSIFYKAAYYDRQAFARCC